MKPPPITPDFENLLQRQLCRDASMLRHLLPPSVAPDVALSPGDGPVEGSVFQFNEMTNAVRPAAEAAAERDTSGATGDKDANISRMIERMILDRVVAAAGNRLSQPLPDDISAQLVPDSYSVVLPVSLRRFTSSGRKEPSGKHRFGLAQIITRGKHSHTLLEWIQDLCFAVHMIE